MTPEIEKIAEIANMIGNMKAQTVVDMIDALPFTSPELRSARDQFAAVAEGVTYAHSTLYNLIHELETSPPWRILARKNTKKETLP